MKYFCRVNKILDGEFICKAVGQDYEEYDLKFSDKDIPKQLTIGSYFGFQTTDTEEVYFLFESIENIEAWMVN